MTKKTNLIWVFVMAICVLIVSWCDKQNKGDTVDMYMTWAAEPDTQNISGTDITVNQNTNTWAASTWSIPVVQEITPKSITSKEISYKVPGDQAETIIVSVVLDNAKNIKSVSMVWKTTEDISAKYQKNFSDNISIAVVGKNISDAKVSQVAWASLTSNAFNLAIDDLIKSI